MLQIGIKKLFISATLLAGMAAELLAQAQGTGTGLQASYYDNKDFSGFVGSRLDATVDFQAFPVPPMAGMTDGETYVVRWQGMFEGPTGSTGNVVLQFRTDDGGRVYVDGKLVIDYWRQGGIAGRGGAAALQQATIVTGVGERHSIRVEMYEQGGGDGAGLDWTHAGQVAAAVVPTINMYPTVGAPRIVSNGGTFTNATLVRLENDWIGATIRYSVNGADINAVGDGLAYTGPFLVNANTTVKARAFSGANVSEPQRLATFTVTDTTAPKVLTVQSVSDALLLVVFSEPIAAGGANTAGNFVSNVGSVSAAALQPDGVSVLLTTTGIAPAAQFTLTLNNLTDRAAAPNPLAANTLLALTHVPPPTATLVDWYRFNEGTGLAAADASGSATGGNAGTLVPGTIEPPVWIEGRIDSALYFNGINNAVNVAALQGVVGNTATVAYWVKTQGRGFKNGNQNFNVQGVLGSSDGGNANGMQYGFLDGGGRIEAKIGNSALNSSGVLINDDLWHHVAITRDAATGVLATYIDGIFRTTVTGDTGAKTAAVTAIGMILATETDCQRWLGGLDEVRIYSSVLTAAEIADLSNRAPTVDAGIDQILTTFNATLNGVITDDGLPNPSAITWTWTQLSGPAVLAPTNGTGGTATVPVTFTQGGVYVFRLTASDGRLTCSDDVTLTLPAVAVIQPLPRLITSEDLTSDTFTIVLTTQPNVGETVTINIVSNDLTEGTVDLAQITFNSTNYNVARVITVTGVDDIPRDMDVDYTVTVTVDPSSPAAFTGTVIPPVLCTNLDNEIPGVIIQPSTGIVVDESGGTAQFQVVLRSQPTANVTINFASSDLSEGTVTPSLLFTAANWNVPQPVTVTGVDDAVIDLDVTFYILTSVTSGDLEYAAINPVDVQCVNRDNEAIPKSEKVWGCGLMGLDGLAGLAALLLWRRRRRA